MQHAREDPGSGCPCHFLEPACLSWDPLSPRTAITPIGFIALVWAELKKGAFFLPAGAPGGQTSDSSPGAAWVFLGKIRLQWSGLWPPATAPRPPTRTGSQAPEHPLCASISSHLPWNRPQQEDSHSWGSRTPPGPATFLPPTLRKPHFQVPHRQVPHGNSQRISKWL